MRSALRPDEVIKELRSYGAQAKANWSDCNEQLEKSLLERGDPLIDLGLACYGSNEEIVGALYKKGLAPADTPLDARYRKGLRIACLSNQVLPSRVFRVTLSGRTKRVAYLVRQIGMRRKRSYVTRR